MDGFFAGGFAKGLESAAQLDQQDQALDIKKKLMGLDDKKLQNAANKDLLDRAGTNFKDIVASGKAIKQNAPDPTQATKALGILRDRLVKTGIMLSQVPGGTALAQNYLDQFDADVLGTPTAQEAGAQKADTAARVAAAETGGRIMTESNFAGVKGAATATEARAKLRTALGREPTAEEVALEVTRPTQNESITVDPKTGAVTITRGNGSGVGNKGAQKLAAGAADKLPELTDQLVALNKVRSLFKPEYLTLAGQADATLTAFMERLGSDRSPEAKQRLADLTTFAANAQSQFNQAVKAMSGAAVSKPEEERLLRDFPDPKSDSPTQFMAKLDAKIQSVKMAVARYSYAAQNGLDWKGISLDNMPNIMRDRAAAIRRDNPNIAAPDLQKQLATEFSLIGF